MSQIVMSKIKILEKLGQGTYSTVHAAFNTDTRTKFALKIMKDVDKNCPNGIDEYFAREVFSMQAFKGEHVVPFQVAYVDTKIDYTAYIEMPIMKKTVADVIGTDTKEIPIRQYLYQILIGLLPIHNADWIHGDIKPQNLLIDESNNLRLCDFNLCQPLRPGVQTCSGLQTLWYRAPEILMGDKNYTTAIDMWSVGCLALELRDRVSPFRGDSDVGQMMKIFQLAGTPTYDGVEKLPDYSPNFPKWESQLKPSKLDTFQDFVFHLLQLDPGKRYTVHQALAHPYFEYFHRSTELEERRNFHRSTELESDLKTNISYIRPNYNFPINFWEILWSWILELMHEHDIFSEMIVFYGTIEIFKKIAGNTKIKLTEYTLKLFAATCLMIATKIWSENPIYVDKLVEYCGDELLKRHILTTENEILTVTQFDFGTNTIWHHVKHNPVLIKKAMVFCLVTDYSISAVTIDAALLTINRIDPDFKFKDTRKGIQKYFQF